MSNLDPNPQERRGHFERFELDNVAPGGIVLRFYATHDPEESRYPAIGFADIPVASPGNFVQEPPELSPVQFVQPQVVECEVVLNSSFTMQVTAPVGQYVKQVVFRVTGQDQWTADTVFEPRA